MRADWYLTAQDNDWCDPLMAAGSSLTSVAVEPSGALLGSGSTSIGMRANQAQQQQQLQSHEAYATRLTMPPNHKPAATSDSLGASDPLAASGSILN